MLALLATTAMGQPQIAVALPAPFAEMMNMMEEMTRQMETRRPPPMNPCMQDMQRLQCPSASCLLAKLPLLQPQCAMLLKGRSAPRPEPSPMPVPVARMAPMMEEFEIEFPDGAEIDVKIESSSDMSAGIPAEFVGLLNALPPEFAGLFGGRAAPRPVPRPAPRPAPAAANEHPCKAEVEHCIAEGAQPGSSQIRGCLNEHIDDPGFSSKCRCFLNQVDATTRKTQPSASPVVRVVPFAEVSYVEVEPPMRHAFCMIVMPLMILLLAHLVRRCCLCLCTTKPQFAAVVPPEAATINTVEPLMCVAVKEVPVKAQA